jgi:CRP-like cAMP-binding protein
MQQISLSPSGVLMNRWGRLPGLTEPERDLLALVDRKPSRSSPSRARLTPSGFKIDWPFLIVSGWACSLRELFDGRRQIIAILLPGDVIGLGGERPIAQESVVTITATRTVSCPELRAVEENPQEFPALKRAIDTASAEGHCFLHDSIVRLGQQTAYERLAHFLLELEHRLSTRGFAVSNGFVMPLTQEAIGDHLGLSIVHVNRTLQLMRREGVITLTNGRLSVLDRDRLRMAAEFLAPAERTLG